jgi:pilus assembly protein Flp/PilA
LVRNAAVGRSVSIGPAERPVKFDENCCRNIREICGFHLQRILKLQSVNSNLERKETALRRKTEKEEAMKALVCNFWQDERGATAIEYGLIAAGISLAIIAAVNGLGTTLNEKFTSINSSLK